MSNSARFLAAFNKIERYLKQCDIQEKSLPFVELLKRAALTNGAVERYSQDLREYAQLRNAIVHDGRGGKVIAEPNGWVVGEIEKIGVHLLSPPKVLSVFSKRTVATLRIHDNVAEAVKLMEKHNFSQIPILDDNKCIDLLTTNTVARWLGRSATEDILHLGETPISRILPSAEDRRVYEFRSETADIFEVVKLFQKYEEEGRRLEALLISLSGKISEPILGIVTIADLPRAFRAIRGW